MPGDIGHLSLQDITNASEEVQRVPRRTTQWAVKGKVQRDRAAQGHKVPGDRLGERLEQESGAIQVFVVDVDRRLIPTFRWRQSGDRDFDSEGVR